MNSFNWECPYCNAHQTVVSAKHYHTTFGLGVSGPNGQSNALELTSIGCANPICERVTVFIKIGKDVAEQGYRISNDPKNINFNQRILPLGSSKIQPDYIPEPIRNDYYEACLIRDLSPKASATLTRRCLQGMIRDFCGISKNRLIDEIFALRTAVDDGSADRSVSIETIDAIDHVRKIGNIGAHMEKDINVIIDVDPNEAQMLIELVELLFEEWYAARFKRAQKLARIELLSVAKETKA